MTAHDDSLPRRRSSFPTTNWSDVARVGGEEFASAIGMLCERYWFPIYAFIRRRCTDPHQAEDLTQGFFEKVITKQLFRAADPARGRFRSYVLTSVQNFLASQYAAQQTQRRGGGQRRVPIDLVTAEKLCCQNRSGTLSPEDEFDRAWAITLLERAIDRLQEEYQAKHQSRRFELLAPTLQSAPLDYAEISTALGIDAVAVRKAVSRLRQRYGQLLREEIAGTLSETGDVEDEIIWIINCFSR